jgi:hypothetical protein
VGLAKHLPSAEDAYRDLAVLDPIDAVRDLSHLLGHFREEAADPEVAELLRARYVDYLARHEGRRRFDQERPRR